jgi:hypothetical protein
MDRKSQEEQRKVLAYGITEDFLYLPISYQDISKLLLGCLLVLMNNDVFEPYSKSVRPAKSLHDLVLS